MPSIAIAGSTGHLGQHITSAVTSQQFLPSFTKVILLSRKDPSQFPPPSAPNIIRRQYHEGNITDVLRDVQILVDAIGHGGHALKDKLIDSVPYTPVRTYFPSEFGVDHYIHDFSHPVWDQKKKHLEHAQTIFSVSAIKICRIFCGVFLEDSIGPWFGFNTRTGVYEAIGSADTPISFTALDDVGKAVAQIAAHSFLFSTDQLPDIVHIAGDTKSFRQIADCMSAAGAGKIQIKELNLKEFKANAVNSTTPDPAQCIRFLMGEGKINNTKRHVMQDVLVNPRQRIWKWRTVADLARETNGRPWKDIEWPMNK